MKFDINILFSTSKLRENRLIKVLYYLRAERNFTRILYIFLPIWNNSETGGAHKIYTVTASLLKISSLEATFFKLPYISAFHLHLSRLNEIRCNRSEQNTFWCFVKICQRKGTVFFTGINKIIFRREMLNITSMKVNKSYKLLRNTSEHTAFETLFL
jgi:hypothetical protein